MRCSSQETISVEKAYMYEEYMKNEVHEIKKVLTVN